MYNKEMYPGSVMSWTAWKRNNKTLFLRMARHVDTKV